MYEKVVNYYEQNLCIDNMFFRKYYKLWTFGIGGLIIFEVLINYLLAACISNLWTRITVTCIVNVGLAITFLLIIYWPYLKKVYKRKVKVDIKFNFKSMLLNEENLSEYRKMEIIEMENFLKKECKIKNIDTIDMIVELINEEIRDKYQKVTFIEKYFSSIIMPLLILVLTVYLNNNTEQGLLQIILTTVISVLTVVVAVNLFSKIKEFKIIPINKKENLLELKRVLLDIKIKWNK